MDGKHRVVVMVDVRYEKRYGEKFAVHEDKGRKLKRMIPVGEFQKQKLLAEKLLTKYGGYLHTSERQEAKAVANGEAFFETVSEATEERIQRIVDAGIPPIFKESFEGPFDNRFPTVDYILQLVSGRLFENYMSDMIDISEGRKIKDKDKPVITHPTILEDILFFRTCAFDERRISPQVINDVHRYISQRFNLDERSLEIVKRHNTRVLRYLEAALGWLEPQERGYAKFTEGQSLDFLKKKMWYIGYTPADRLRVLNDFRKRALSGEKGVFNPRSVLKMEQLFPDEARGLCEDFARAEERERHISKAISLNKAIETRDYRDLGETSFDDKEHADLYRKSCINYLREECRRLLRENPMALCIKSARVMLRSGEPFKVPSSYAKDPGIRDMIIGYQRKALKGLSDEQLRSLTGNFNTSIWIVPRVESDTSLEREYKEEFKKRLRKAYGR